ncbi:MAG: hypothetical protein WCG45_04810, partial [bacterium]
MQIKNETKIYKFLDFLEHLLCKKCWNNSTCLSDGIDDEIDRIHHDGIFLHFLGLKPKIKKDSFNRWILDTEHGFL